MYSLSYALRSGVCVLLKKLDQPSVQSSLSATTFYSIHHLNSMMEMLQTMQRLIVRYPEHDFELVWF